MKRVNSPSVTRTAIGFWREVGGLQEAAERGPPLLDAVKAFPASLRSWGSGDGQLLVLEAAILRVGDRLRP